MNLKPVKSLRLKCYLATILAVAVLCCVAMLTSNLVHSYTLDARYSKLKLTVAQTVKGIADANKAERYISGADTEEHIKDNIRLQKLVEDIGDIHSIGMYKFTGEGMYTVFDTTSESIRGGVGEYSKYTKEWEKEKNSFLEGDIVENLSVPFAEGRTEVYCMPVADTADGGYVYICVGVLESLTESIKTDFFVKNSKGVIFAAIIFIILMGIYIELKILKPINTIAELVKKAASGTDSKLLDDILGAKINSAEEIENINRSLIKIYTAKVRLSSVLSKVNTATTSAILSIIKRMDNFAAVHLDNSLQYVIVLASCMRKAEKYKGAISKKVYDDILLAASFHDIGKLSIPNHILNKPSALTEEEYNVIKQHTVLGAKIIDGLHGDGEPESYLKLARQIAMYHHERWDGAGYPEGLKGEEIPLPVRIVAVADVFDALVSKRVYKDALPFEKAFSMIMAESGKAFDPDVVDVFAAQKKKIYELYLKLGNH